MNFFQQQVKAKRDTKRLLALLLLALVLLLAMTNFALYFIISYVDTSFITIKPSSFKDFLTTDYSIYASIILIGFIFIASLSKQQSLKQGGDSIAIALKGKRVPTNTIDFQKKQLLNVVQEMAIASGIQVPNVYILPEYNINAFAAGFTPNTAVIGVTQGLLDALDRDELQGVIAHEFSHIFNGDMRLNIELIGTLHGILLLGLIGKKVLSFEDETSFTHERKKSSGNLLLLATGFSLIAIGYVGYFIGSIIKAMVNRKREYLADATAVQYTRYPQGIANALKKIGGHSGSTISATQANTYSHLFFDTAIDAFFATHPPLDKRIREIQPNWDGKYLAINKPKEEPTPKKQKPEKQNAFTFTAINVIENYIDSIGTISEVSILDTIPTAILQRTKDTLSAQALVLSFLVQESTKEQQYAYVEKHNKYILLELASCYASTITPTIRLSVIHLCVSTLKNLSLEQYKQFKQTLDFFIQADKKVSMLEWSLQTIVISTLDQYFLSTKPLALTHYYIGSVKKELEIILSLLCYKQTNHDDKAFKLFNNAKKVVKLGALQYVSNDAIVFEDFIYATKALQKAKIPLKKRIFEAVLASVASDNTLEIYEKEIVHAMATLLELPLPHFSGTV